MKKLFFTSLMLMCAHAFAVGEPTNTTVVSGGGSIINVNMASAGSVNSATLQTFNASVSGASTGTITSMPTISSLMGNSVTATYTSSGSVTVSATNATSGPARAAIEGFAGNIGFAGVTSPTVYYIPPN